MESIQRPVDWHRIEQEQRPVVTAVDSRVRLRAGLMVFLLLLAVVFGRVAQLELTQGAVFRRVANRPIVEQTIVPCSRGRIVSRDGIVLAENREVCCLAVRYRQLEGHRDLDKRFAELCGLSIDEWDRRAAGIRRRVERIAQTVNRRRQKEYERRRREQPPEPALFDHWFGSQEEPPPEVVVVREQRDPRGELDYHVMVEDLSEAVVAEIENHPKQYPGTRIIKKTRRNYPAGPLAAHVVGYLGPVSEKESESNGQSAYSPGERRGRAGIERQFERQLRGRQGVREETTDQGHRVVSSRWIEKPRAGDDLVLSIDARLQATAERLLDEALARRDLIGCKPKQAGGAAVVMDVHSGEILALASVPRFEPRAFDGRHSAEAARLLSDSARPLIDRAIQMAIAPGSVMKVVTAAALASWGRMDPSEPFYCRGYLDKPTALRCQIYREQERGHGETTMADALAVSCNVYFFHHVGRMGPGPLIDWSHRFGLGRPTGIDLVGESAGCVPTPDSIESLEGHAWMIDDTRRVAVGQGSMTATPMQIARIMAAVANGGRLIVPHVASYWVPGATGGDDESQRKAVVGRPVELYKARQIAGLDESVLETVRKGLRMAVESDRGTAHATVFMDAIAVAGKTGTAQTARDRSPHAWFAGYVPADEPRFAMVVTLAHSGGGGEVAGPVARRLIERMRQIGLVE